MTETMLKVQGLGLSFGAQTIFQGLNFTLAPGETLALVGPSGCGKSSLLHILAGLKPEYQGRVELSSLSSKSLVMQNYGLFPWKTLGDNVELPLILSNTKAPLRRKQVQAILAEMGLTGLETRYPNQLSGGQQQRVALGRALIAEPHLLLLDEPFSALDALTREKLQNLLLKLWAKRGLSYILATHDIEEAVFLGRTILVMGGQPAHFTFCLNNTSFGQREGRFSQEYFQLVKTIRRSLAPGDQDDIPPPARPAESGSVPMSSS